MALIINGTTVNSAQPFPKTSSSTVFSNAITTVSLNVGDNSIRLQSTTSTATADIDWIEITGNTPAAANCAGTMARTASLVTHDDATDQKRTGVYPNPCNSKATVTVTLEKNEQAVISVYDAQGRMVANPAIISSVTGGTQQVPCNLTGKKPGLYYVLIISNKGLKATHKLVVE
jgi:pectate lyase